MTSINLNGLQEIAKGVGKNPTSMVAINIYLGIMIFLVSFYFFYYIKWDIGEKRTTTCRNVVNNIKEFSEKNGVPDYYVSEPRLTMNYGNFDAWKKCSEAKATVGETKNKDEEGEEGNDSVCEDIKLKDHFFMGCYNAAGCGDEWRSYVDDRKKPTGGTVLEAVLNSGVRVVDFELFLKKKGDQLVVGNGIPAEKNKYQLKGSYNDIPFSDIIDTLKHFVKQDGTDKIFRNHPLLVNLRIGSHDPNIYIKLGADLSANELSAFTPNSNHLLKTFIIESESVIGDNGSSYRDIVDTPIKENNGKIIFILNDNPLNPFGKYIENLGKEERETDNLLKYICVTDSQYLNMGNAIVSSSNNIINAHNKDEVINGFKKYLGIALPDWSSIIKNPDYFKHMSMGCQISLLKFSLNDVNLRDYFNYWNKKSTRLVIKPRNNSSFIGLEEDSNDIVEIRNSAPMTTRQDKRMDANSQVDELLSGKMSGTSVAHGMSQYTK